MVDSRAKGRAAELAARNELRKLTKLDWERTPLSGALDPKHKLKGDLYVPGLNIQYCIEVKHYKDDHVNTKLITGKNPQFLQWWKQTEREAEQIDKFPLLIFKHNRSKWFAAFDLNDDAYIRMDDHQELTPRIILHPSYVCISLLADFCDHVEWFL